MRSNARVNFVNREAAKKALDKAERSSALFRKHLDPSHTADPRPIYPRDFPVRNDVPVQRIDQNVAVEGISAQGV